MFEKKWQVVRGFCQCGYIGWNGDISTLHSKLRATVESREVPAEVITFLEEMRMAEAEEVVHADERNDEQGDEQQAEEEQNRDELDDELNDELDNEEEIDILF